MAQTEEKITLQQTVSTNPEEGLRSQDPGFEARHKKQLGVGKFAQVTAFNNLFPLATGGAGAVAGLYGTPRTISERLPKGLKNVLKGARAAEALAGVGVETLIDIAGKGSEAFSGDPLKRVKALAELGATLHVDPEKAEKVLGIIHREGGNSNEKFIEIAEALGHDLSKMPKTVRGAAAFALGFAGLVAGGITIGYREWRKKESARLAAEEINRDIAGMELFKPSNPELVAENKRLHTMVAALPAVDTSSTMAAALPTVDPSSIESQGRVQNHEPQAALS